MRRSGTYRPAYLPWLMSVNLVEMEKQKKNKLALPLLAAAMVAGISVGALGVAGAQSAAAADTSTTTSAVTTSGTSAAAHPRGHAPLGGDGIVASINGTTLTMTEEADEGGATYTIDASNATVTKDGATASLASIAVGDKIFVKGTVTGTNVVATSVNSGRGGAHGFHKDSTSSPAGSAAP